MKKGIAILAVIFAILLLLGTFSSIELPRSDPGGSSQTTPEVTDPGIVPVSGIVLNPDHVYF